MGSSICNDNHNANIIKVRVKVKVENGKIKVMVKARVALKAVWQFCSYLFVPQWGKHRVHG
jgi:hypothetical protein